MITQIILATLLTMHQEEPKAAIFKEDPAIKYFSVNNPCDLVENIEECYASYLHPKLDWVCYIDYAGVEVCVQRSCKKGDGVKTKLSMCTIVDVCRHEDGVNGFYCDSDG